MKTLLKSLIIATALTCATYASAYTITSGGPSGTYYKVANNLSNIVPGGAVLKSKGSIENLDRLKNKEADLAIIQADAMAWYFGKYPEMVSQIEVMGSLYKECVHIAVAKKGKVRNEDDLQKKGVTIAIGKQGSGSAVTWDYMMKLEPGYKKAAVSFTGGSRAFNKLARSTPDANNTLDAVMWVTKPTLNDKSLKAVINHPDLEMIAVNDKDLNDTYKPLGRPIYEFEGLPTKDGLFSSGKLTTPCVEALLVAHTDTDEEILDSVADIILNYKTSLLRTN